MSALVPFALVACVLAVIIGAIIRALGGFTNNPHRAASGKTTVLWSLVAAIVIGASGFAVGWAHDQGTTKTGILVALAGALLLGAGTGYLSWLQAGQAAAFTADPASYKAETVAPQPGIEIVDKTADWMVAVNHYRRATPAAEATPDSALEMLAASCASKLAGGTGACPGHGQYYAVKLSPSALPT